jgi:hypothetical protein
MQGMFYIRIKTSMMSALLGLPFLLAGCASYRIQPIAGSEVARWGDAQSPLKEGYIFYQPELYFAATIALETEKDKEGKEQTKESISVAPLYLPNYQKPYRLTTHNVLGKADFGFDLENGWKLTKLSDKSDNSTVASSLAGELKTLLSVTGLPVARSGVTAKSRVVLYRPVYDEKTGFFSGFAEAGIVQLPIPQR